jgi:hypothetical protein
MSNESIVSRFSSRNVNPTVIPGNGLRPDASPALPTSRDVLRRAWELRSSNPY